MALTYESRNVDRQVGTYYTNTAYSVGSIGLNYGTAKFYNFSANVVEAYQPVWRGDSHFVTAHGKGDASERFFMKMVQINIWNLPTRICLCNKRYRCKSRTSRAFY